MTIYCLGVVLQEVKRSDISPVAMFFMIMMQVHYASVDKIPADGDRSGVVLR